MEVGQVNLAQSDYFGCDVFTVEICKWDSVYQLSDIIKLSMEFDGRSHFPMNKDSIICSFKNYEQALLFKMTAEL